jgi:hypothetical protein
MTTAVREFRDEDPSPSRPSLEGEVSTVLAKRVLVVWKDVETFDQGYYESVE